jgi:hypothetical protein
LIDSDRERVAAADLSTNVVAVGRKAGGRLLRCCCTSRSPGHEAITPLR